MSEPAWYRSRLKSWVKPKINTKREKCPMCNVPMTITPRGLVCFYCTEYGAEEGEG